MKKIYYGEAVYDSREINAVNKVLDSLIYRMIFNILKIRKTRNTRIIINNWVPGNIKLIYVVKIDNKSIHPKKLFAYLDKNSNKIMKLNNFLLKKIIFKSCLIKKKVVQKDEKESPKLEISDNFQGGDTTENLRQNNPNDHKEYYKRP